MYAYVWQGAGLIGAQQTFSQNPLNVHRTQISFGRSENCSSSTLPCNWCESDNRFGAAAVFIYFGICMWSTFPGEAKTGNWCESDNGFGAAANLTPSPRWETFPPNILRARQWVAIDDVERNVRLVMLPFDPEVLLWTATKCTFLGFFTIAKENHHNSILQLLGNPFLRWFGFSWRKCLFLLSW